jgi:hypothetical protein
LKTFSEKWRFLFRNVKDFNYFWRLLQGNEGFFKDCEAFWKRCEAFFRKVYVAFIKSIAAEDFWSQFAPGLKIGFSVTVTKLRLCFLLHFTQFLIVFKKINALFPQKLVFTCLIPVTFPKFLYWLTSIIFTTLFSRRFNLMIWFIEVARYQ